MKRPNSMSNAEFLKEVLRVKTEGGCTTDGITLTDARARGLLAEMDSLKSEELRLCARLQEEREASRKLAALVEQARPIMEDIAECDPAVRAWLKNLST